MTFRAEFQCEDTLTAKFGEVIQQYVIPDPYDGEYVVIPKTVGQVLETKFKSMERDVTVKEIPYAETTNETGITVVIAS